MAPLRIFIYIFNSMSSDLTSEQLCNNITISNTEPPSWRPSTIYHDHSPHQLCYVSPPHNCHPSITATSLCNTLRVTSHDIIDLTASSVTLINASVLQTYQRTITHWIRGHWSIANVCQSHSRRCLPKLSRLAPQQQRLLLANNKRQKKYPHLFVECNERPSIFTACKLC